MRANPATLRRERRLKLAAFLSVLAATFLFLMAISDIFISLLLAILIVYVLRPAVNFFERRGLTRSLSISLIFVLITATLVGAGFLVAPMVTNQFAEFQTEMPRYKAGIEKMVASVENDFNHSFGKFYQVHIMESAAAYGQKYVISYVEQLPQMASGILTIMLLAPFFAFFLLRDGRDLSRALLSLVPNNLFEMTLSLSHKINEQIGGFIRARILESAIVGAVVWIGLAILDFPYAVLLSVFAGITNLIPYVGPIIGAVPALVVAMVDTSGSTMVLAVTIVYVVGQIIDMVFIIPLVVAKIVNLHPILVVLSIMAGAKVGGVVGMIISIPVTSALKLIFSTLYNQVLAQRSDI